MRKKTLKLSHLLQPHRTMLVIAFIAVLGEAGTDLLEPWPLKIVFDYVFGTKHMPGWMSGALSATFGLNGSSSAEHTTRCLPRTDYTHTFTRFSFATKRNKRHAAIHKGTADHLTQMEILI